MGAHEPPSNIAHFLQILVQSSKAALGVLKGYMARIPGIQGLLDYIWR